MIRIFTMAGAIAGAVGFSQFPEFSQQYLQRLSGAVDELRTIVIAFDASASKSGITREEALAELEGSEFQTDLRDTLSGQITRYERLSADYAALKEAQPLGRLAQLYRFRDTDLARRTWDDFRPAVPATSDGLIFAGIGFFSGWLLLAGALALVIRLFRRRRKADA